MRSRANGSAGRGLSLPEHNRTDDRRGGPRGARDARRSVQPRKPIRVRVLDHGAATTNDRTVRASAIFTF